MKKLIAGLALLASSVAMAGGPGHHGYHGHRHYNPNWWIAPAVIGGVVTYAFTRPPVPPQPVVVIQPQQVPVAPVGYHYENILDSNCNCYRLVLVPNYGVQ